MVLALTEKSALIWMFAVQMQSKEVHIAWCHFRCASAISCNCRNAVTRMARFELCSAAGLAMLSVAIADRSTSAPFAFDRPK